MKNLQISVSTIKELGKVSRGPEAYFCAAVADVSDKQDLTVSFTLADCENEVLLTGHIKGNIKLSCSRCLEETDLPIDIKMCASFPATQETVDVDEEIKQLILLNLPIKPLCREDCKGLCAVCGRNKNAADCGCSTDPIDPRWGKLKQILK